jgi:hypothetical protein
MAWTLVGRATITAADFKVEVGTVTLPASGALEVRVKQISPAETSVFRSGLLYVRTTTGGRELGSKRFWGHLEGEDYVLGSAGQVDVGGEGVLVLEPRAINLKALKSPSLSPWVLDVWVRPLALATGGGGDGGGTTPTPTPEPTPDRDLLTGQIEEHGDSGQNYGSGQWVTVPGNTTWEGFNYGITLSTPLHGVYTFRVLVRDDTSFGSAGIKSRNLSLGDGSALTASSEQGAEGGAWVAWTIPNPPQTVLGFGFEPNDWGAPCRMQIKRAEVNGGQLLNIPGLPYVQLADETDLKWLLPGQSVTEDGGGGDATGTISEVKVAERRILFSSSTGTWSLGARVRKAR